MRRSLITAILLLATLAAATPGIFSGELVPPPASAEEGAWVWVKGRNSLVRRVDVASARVFYAESISEGDRRRDASESLVPGAEVRVTADQNADGEWRAREIEITRIASVR